MSFSGINYLAVIIAAIAGFGVGALWYSVIFVKPWMAAMGITEAEITARRASGTAPPIAPLLGGSIVGNLVMAFILSACCIRWASPASARHWALPSFCGWASSSP